MKLIRLLILILVFLASKIACGQTKVTLNYQRVHFEEIITAIQHQTVYRFIYRADQLPTQLITLSVKNAEVLPLLDNLLKGTHYYYRLTANNLIAIGTEKDSIKNGAINGIVTNEKDQPISGASVRIKNSNYGIETDKEGRFVINGIKGATIEISNIGYNTQQVIITTTDQPLKITLQDAYHSLE